MRYPSRTTRKIGLTAVFLMALFSRLHAQILTNDPAVTGYFSNPTGLEYSSGVIYAQVILNSTNPITNAGSELALFDGTNCAGYATIVNGPPGTGVEFCLTAHSDITPGATMIYKFWNSATDLLYSSNISETYSFQNLIGAGSIAQPITLNAFSPVPESSRSFLITVGLLTLLVVHRIRGRA